MNNKEHKCVFGCKFNLYNPEEGKLLDEPMIQINGGDIIEYFKYCPKCGKQNSHSVLLTEYKFTNILNKKF